MERHGTARSPRSSTRGFRPLLAAWLLGFLLAGMRPAAAPPSRRLEEEAHGAVLLVGIRQDARTQVLHLSRNKRYTLTPEKLKWDKFKLTYKLLSFPTNLINASDTRRGLAKAFGMWSDVSPFTFREVPADQEADIKIGFYPVNHTDCLQSYLHHCFDGITGELAHAFFPPTGEIHFDDDEYWIVGNMRFSWKRGVWLTDLIHVATHEIGHALGLMHSMNPKAIMHLNATLTGRKLITQDEVWGLHRLYGNGPNASTFTELQNHCPMFGPLVYLSCLGPERLLRQQAQADAAPLPLQLRLLLRIPFPHGSPHPISPQDQTQAGGGGKEAHVSLWEENRIKERQSALVQRWGAAGVLPPQLHLAEGRPHHHRGQRHQRGHVHVRGEEKGQSSHQLLVEGACSLLKRRCGTRVASSRFTPTVSFIQSIFPSFPVRYRPAPDWKVNFLPFISEHHTFSVAPPDATVSEIPIL